MLAVSDDVGEWPFPSLPLVPEAEQLAPPPKVSQILNLRDTNHDDLVRMAFSGSHYDAAVPPSPSRSWDEQQQQQQPAARTQLPPYASFVGKGFKLEEPYWTSQMKRGLAFYETRSGEYPLRVQAKISDLKQQAAPDRRREEQVDEALRGTHGPSAACRRGRPAVCQEPPAQAPTQLILKTIGSVQSPGVVNWERVSGHEDEDFFEVVNDGISVLQPGTYQINVDLQHSQPRVNYKFVFKVWHSKTLLGQCSTPLRTKKEVSLSLLEMRCQLPALAKLRVEFLAPGFAFHESRIVLRLVQ